MNYEVAELKASYDLISSAVQSLREEVHDLNNELCTSLAYLELLTSGVDTGEDASLILEINSFIEEVRTRKKFKMSLKSN